MKIIYLKRIIRFSWKNAGRKTLYNLFFPYFHLALAIYLREIEKRCVYNVKLNYFRDKERVNFLQLFNGEYKEILKFYFSPFLLNVYN